MNRPQLVITSNTCLLFMFACMMPGVATGYWLLVLAFLGQLLSSLLTLSTRVLLQAVHLGMFILMYVLLSQLKAQVRWTCMCLFKYMGSERGAVASAAFSIIMSHTSSLAGVHHRARTNSCAPCLHLSRW